MDAATAAIVGVLAIAAGHLWWRTRSTASADAPSAVDPLVELAERLNVDATDRDEDGNLSFEHERVKLVLGVKDRTRFELRIDTEGHLPGWLHVFPRRPGQPEPAGTTQTQDHFFDLAFWTFGSPRALAAVLRHPVRARLLALRNVTIRPGVIESRCTASRLVHVEQWFESVMKVMHALEHPPEDLDGALLEVLRDEPNPNLRLHVLTLLNEPQVDPLRKQAALTASLDDAEPKLRCYAALRLTGPQARAELEKLAGGFEVSEDLRLSAFHGLFKQTSGENLVPMLVEAAAGPESRLSRRALSWAVGYGGRNALRRVVARPRLPVESLRVALKVARRLQADEVVPELLTMLEWEGASDERRLIAVEGLGALASTQAVPALRRVARRDPGLGVAVQAAVARIQSRSRVDTAGALSFTDGDRGGLAVVESGRLGLSDDGQ